MTKNVELVLNPPEVTDLIAFVARIPLEAMNLKLGGDDAARTLATIYKIKAAVEVAENKYCFHWIINSKE